VTETYTGDVTVGGGSDTRDTGPLLITKVAVGPMNNNAYFLRCVAGGDVLLIDAANEPDRLLRELGDNRLGRIVTTHQHFDHWQALPELFAASRGSGGGASAGRRRAAGREGGAARGRRHGDRR
jgi:glyoxylase-like metal-dependent hydrolase (beta-lactamase superfamily II)